MPYTATQMYALVVDVEAYPDFLPWCTAAEVHAQTQNTLEASIAIGIRGLNTRFGTRNQLRPPGAMTMALLDGPFRSLQGEWRFEQLGDAGCEVQLTIDFEFESAATDLLFGAGFEKICNDLIDAFIKRAHTCYG